MKKKTLVILLVIPFIISLLTFASIKILDNQVAVDILGIQWDYQEYEGFQVSDRGYELKASPIVDPNLILANGNSLTWSTRKLDESDEDCARIEEKDDRFYLYALKPGEVEVICSNERGSKSKHFIATIFEDGAMIINPVRKGSSSSISKTKYYGLYDYDSDGSKVKSFCDIASTSYLDDGSKSSRSALLEKSDNVDYKDGRISFLSSGEGYVTLEEPEYHYRSTYRFSIIDGINVYSYSDLLSATNLSKDGENVVLQVNLESLKNTYQKDDKGRYIDRKLETAKDNTEVFGNYDFSLQKFSFDQEYYSFDTTYDSTYIDQYNSTKGSDYSKKVHAGIHLRKNLYGNGFTINMNGLCYPNFGEIDKFTGKLVPRHNDGSSPYYDYFFGPLPFVSIGDMNSMPLVTALGQDNSGIYVDDDNVVIDDVKLSNVDEVDNLYNLSYTGSIVDVKGKDVTIRNSVLSNAKVCIRAYDSDNLTIDNCILKNSGEFTLLVGSDRKNGYNTGKTIQEAGNMSFADFYDDTSEDRTDTANGRLNAFLSATMDGKIQDKDYKSDLELVQKYLDNTDNIQSDQYANNIRVNNTFFGRSGVFSIASESMFNGPLLYGKIPSMITGLLSMLDAPLPEKIAGTSYPVHVTLTGDTRFYDWKDIDSIDVSSLIEENISRTLTEMGFGDKNITIDDIFPMKKALKRKASGFLYQKDGKSYLNTSIAYYGGGLNVSRIENRSDRTYNTYSDEIEVSLVDEQIQDNKGGGYSSLLVDCVLVTIGSHPFRFVINGSEEKNSPMLFDQVPSIDGLKKHLQEIGK